MNFSFDYSYSVVSDIAVDSIGFVACVALPLAMRFVLKAFGLPILLRCCCWLRPCRLSRNTINTQAGRVRDGCAVEGQAS